jgi:predicted acetyltransferase
VDPEPLLRPLTEDDRLVVERLWQLYSHDMSEVRGTFPNSEGLYKEGRLPGYFGDPDRSGYLITLGDVPVGFAFVQGLSGETRMIGDFFVARAARRQGVGHKVARELLAKYRGRWEIGFQGGNRGAPEFWRCVASDVVGTEWREERRPVPNKPRIPHDHFIVFSNADA